ncbi:uncharacterized protein RCC_06160 [Ramularia collo-cygni]|uniref:Uncharacterized protein n=1 Tax=Ramularia collo-cygni TaxID=112498 RepID=A0A2D3UUM7_9PEZI|nr:uncharacterized protein RCC_06160 [Ramularia collo-cygni]CZT20301.1 uncharacterized protein RCC_06160 [Ramularia collo-cygni]
MVSVRPDSERAPDKFSDKELRDRQLSRIQSIVGPDPTAEQQPTSVDRPQHPSSAMALPTASKQAAGAATAQCSGHREDGCQRKLGSEQLSPREESEPEDDTGGKWDASADDGQRKLASQQLSPREESEPEGDTGGKWDASVDTDHVPNTRHYDHGAHAYYPQRCTPAQGAFSTNDGPSYAELSFQAARTSTAVLNLMHLNGTVQPTTTQSEVPQQQTRQVRSESLSEKMATMEYDEYGMPLRTENDATMRMHAYAAAAKRTATLSEGIQNDASQPSAAYDAVTATDSAQRSRISATSEAFDSTGVSSRAEASTLSLPSIGVAGAFVRREAEVDFHLATDASHLSAAILAKKRRMDKIKASETPTAIAAMVGGCALESTLDQSSAATQEIPLPMKPSTKRPLTLEAEPVTQKKRKSGKLTTTEELLKEEF